LILATIMTTPFLDQLNATIASLEAKVIAFRRDLHANPELGNREFRTAQVIEKHLREIGVDDLRTGVAVTGLVAVIKGAHPGPCVALRADMDGLPVKELANVPFASKATTQWCGEEVGVMHACGHDCHVAILMGVAEAFAKHRAQLHGSVKLIFQPAEEGLPEGEHGGAKRMIDEAALADPKPDAIFGLHVVSLLPTGVVGYRPGAIMASTDNFNIRVRGRQTHGAMPWGGTDSVLASAHVVVGLQQIISRNLDITEEPAVVTVGAIKGGTRENIIPDEVEMKGTFRTFSEMHRQLIRDRITEVATNTACACGARAEVSLHEGYPVTVNDTKLTLWSLPTLARAAGEGKVQHVPKTGGGEDFSYFLNNVPGAFYFLGVTPPSQDPRTAPANHSPLFYADEAAFVTGMRLLTHLVTDFQAEQPLR
jgi:amidohydrolase